MDLIFDDDWDFDDTKINSIKQNTYEQKQVDKKQLIDIFGHNVYTSILEHYNSRQSMKQTPYTMIYSIGYKKWYSHNCFPTMIRYQKQNEFLCKLLREINKNGIGDFMQWLLIQSQSLSFLSIIENSGIWQSYSYDITLPSFQTSFLCPFHKERTASFKYHESSGGFHCYGCGKHINAIGMTAHF